MTLDLTLRSEKSSPLSFTEMDNNLQKLQDALNVVDGIKNLKTSGGLQHVKGFYVGSSVGGGEFYYDATLNKSKHNGIVIIAPEAIAAWDGTAANITTLLNWVGSGSGCFIKISGFSASSCGATQNYSSDVLSKMPVAGISKIVIDMDLGIEKPFSISGNVSLVSAINCKPKISFLSTSSQRGITFDEGKLYIKGIEFKSGGIVDQLMYLKNKDGVRIENCEFDFSATTQALTGGEHGGIYAENLNNAYFEKNIFKNSWREKSFNAGSVNGFGGNNLARVINISNTSVNYNVQFNKNTFFNVWSCVYINNTNSIVFDKNYVQETADSGFFDRCTAGYSKGKKFTKNVFVDIGKTAIKTLDTNNVTPTAYASDALVSGNSFFGWGKYINAECLLIARGFDSSYVWQSLKNFDALVENNLFEQKSGFITKRPFLFINVQNLRVINNTIKIVDDNKTNEIYIFQWCKNTKLIKNIFNTDSRIFISYNHEGESKVKDNSFKVGKEIEITGQQSSIDQYHLFESNMIENSETGWRHFGLVFSNVTSNCFLKYTDNMHITGNTYQDAREPESINMIGMAYPMPHLVDNNVVKFSDRFATQKSMGGDILYAIYYQGTKGGCKLNPNNGQIVYKATDGRTTGGYYVNGTSL